MKHTPAPWRVTHISTHEAPNNHVHTFEVYTDPKNDHNNMIGLANARLIAAAPELLEALIYAEDLISGVEADLDSERKIENVEELRNAWQKFQQLIQKATQP